VPARNAGATLDACLSAIAQQTLAPDSITVFDDGSSDDTAAIAGSHQLSWEDRAGYRLDYAETLKLWRQRFDAAVKRGRLDGFGDEFQRLWRYYLMYCEGGFRGGGIDVAQVTMVKS